MQIQIKTSFLLYMFMFSLCLNTLFLGNTDAQFITEPFGASAGPNYTFESIDVPGVDYLELTASSDFENYAGNTRSADGQKIVGFTLIDGVFNTQATDGTAYQQLITAEYIDVWQMGSEVIN